MPTKSDNPVSVDDRPSITTASPVCLRSVSQSIGGNAYTEAVQKELNLPFDAAEQLKKGQAVNGITAQDVHPVLHAMTENVLLEVQKTFDFFKATAASDRIDRIVLSGGASRVDGFAAALQERFGAAVDFFDSRGRETAGGLLAEIPERSAPSRPRCWARPFPRRKP